jgi:hypothetical protein
MTLLVATVKGRATDDGWSRTEELGNEYLYGWSETPSADRGGHD